MRYGPVIRIAMAAFTILPGWSETAPDLVRQIADLMRQAPSGQAGQRFLHAKGNVCEGTFEASPEAKSISRAAHFQGSSVPVTVRLSDSAPDAMVADNSSDAVPHGMAIRFMTGRGTDIVANSHNGFLVGTPEDFLAFLKAKAATDPSKPHPWPVEQFIGSHPAALKFVQDIAAIPASFATESFFGNNTFQFVNAAGKTQPGRYQIVPVSGSQFLDAAAAKAKSPDYLRQDLTARLAKGPVKFRLILQLPAAGDQLNDASVVWPDDRKKIELGVITINKLVTDSAAAEKALAFDPTRLTDGIQLSNDPLLALRSRIYAISAAPRQKH